MGVSRSSAANADWAQSSTQRHVHTRPCRQRPANQPRAQPSPQRTGEGVAVVKAQAGYAGQRELRLRQPQRPQAGEELQDGAGAS